MQRVVAKECTQPMKTKTKTQQQIGVTVNDCKLERLKMTGGYGSASQAEAWAKGIESRQTDIGCAVARKPKRPGAHRHRRIHPAADLAPPAHVHG